MSNVTFDMKHNSMEVHDAAAEPWRVTLIDTGEKTMIGGRIKRILPYVGDDKEFCLTYGDGVGDVDIRAAIDLHRKEGRLATVTATQPPGRFGAINYQGNRVTGFQEKPIGDGGWINGGFFVLSPEVGRLHRGRRDRLGTGADAATRGRGPAQRLFPPRLLAADGHAPRQTASGRSLGLGQGALENLVNEGAIRMRILITGNMGYVGPVLTRFLRENLDDAELIGFDAGFFGHSLTGASVLPEALLDRQVFGDIRELPAELLDGVDAVVHLSAVSNDPMGNKFEDVTGEINQEASVRIAQAGGRARASRISSLPRAAACTATPRAARARRAIRPIR